MRVDDLDYDFDPSLVAREPASPRDSARMLVYDRASARVEHRLVRDLDTYLRAGDTIVVNQTTVMPARIKAIRERGGGARIEGLLLEARGERRWLALLRNAKRVADGERLALVGPGSETPSEYGIVVHGRDDEAFLVSIEGGGSAEEVLSKVGWTPLPPYIVKARRDDGRPDDGLGDLADRAAYQTVYATESGDYSVAAPTAGLHFTPELLSRVASRGVERVSVALQVGAGTFKPIETVTLEEHRMHRERCVVSRDVTGRLRATRERGGRIVAVGTTTVRTLESLPVTTEGDEPLVWETDILIAPGHRFTMTDAMLTNFHLPRSTLIALVAAFVGLETLRSLYATAQRERYRFYSFGDAMLIV